MYFLNAPAKLAFDKGEGDLQLVQSLLITNALSFHGAITGVSNKAGEAESSGLLLCP